VKAFATLTTVCTVIAVASWAYAVNYDTRAVKAELRELRTELAREQEQLAVLKIEWAYLNRPERLRALVQTHSAQLGLMPADPGHFGQITQVPYPDKPPAPTTPPRRPTLPMTLEEALVFTGAKP
jgi:hypothetical protein